MASCEVSRRGCSPRLLLSHLWSAKPAPMRFVSVCCFVGRVGRAGPQSMPFCRRVASRAVSEQTGEYVFVERDDVVRALSAFIAEYIGGLRAGQHTGRAARGPCLLLREGPAKRMSASWAQGAMGPKDPFCSFPAPGPPATLLADFVGKEPQAATPGHPGLFPRLSPWTCSLPAAQSRCPRPGPWSHASCSRRW